MDVEITVKLFGPEAEVAGRRQVTVSVGEAATCGQLRAALAKREPLLAPRLPACRLAVNHEFAGDERPLGEQDEVALIGLVSGG
jgi:molybdopterin converting factor small subunit